MKIDSIQNAAIKMPAEKPATLMKRHATNCKPFAATNHPSDGKYRWPETLPFQRPRHRSKDAISDRLRQQWLGKVDAAVNADGDLPDCRKRCPAGSRRRSRFMGCTGAE